MNIAPLLDRLLPKKVIVNCDRDAYLHRWYLLKTKRLAIFIHRFVRSDEDRALHDHPWPFLVVPLWRGYIEHSERNQYVADEYGDVGPLMVEAVPVKRRVLPILGTRLRPATHRHRVELLPCDYKGAPDTESQCPKCGGLGFMPSWSLFIHFKRVRDWGFWNAGVFQLWNDFWKEKCE